MRFLSPFVVFSTPGSYDPAGYYGIAKFKLTAAVLLRSTELLRSKFNQWFMGCHQDKQLARPEQSSGGSSAMGSAIQERTCNWVSTFAKLYRDRSVIAGGHGLSAHYTDTGASAVALSFIWCRISVGSNFMFIWFYSGTFGGHFHNHQLAYCAVVTKMISKASIAKASKAQVLEHHVACQTSINSHRSTTTSDAFRTASGSMRVRRRMHIYAHGLFGTKLQAQILHLLRRISACRVVRKYVSSDIEGFKNRDHCGKDFEKVFGWFQIERSSHL